MGDNAPTVNVTIHEGQAENKSNQRLSKLFLLEEDNEYFALMDCSQKEQERALRK